MEKPQRFTRVLERCRELGLIDRCTKLAPRCATEVELFTVHSEKLIDFMKKTAEEKDENVLRKFSSK